MKVFRDIMGVPRSLWSKMACCKYIYTINKGGGGEQFERERHSIQTGLTMPRQEVEAIIRKLDSKNNGASAVFTLTYAPYTDVEQTPRRWTAPWSSPSSWASRATRASTAAWASQACSWRTTRT